MLHQTKRPNSVSSHSLRFKKKGKPSASTTKAQVVPISVYLLQEPDLDDDDEESQVPQTQVVFTRCNLNVVVTVA